MGGLDELSSLEKLYKLITKIYPQDPTSHRGEAHMIDSCASQLLGFIGHRTASRIDTQRLSFQQLYESDKQHCKLYRQFIEIGKATFDRNMQKTAVLFLVSYIKAKDVM